MRAVCGQRGGGEFDSRSGRRLLEVLLLELGYRVVSAASGPQAFELLAHEPVDVILLDLLMPQMDGFEVGGTACCAERPLVRARGPMLAP